MFGLSGAGRRSAAGSACRPAPPAAPTARSPGPTVSSRLGTTSFRVRHSSEMCTVPMISRSTDVWSSDSKSNSGTGALHGGSPSRGIDFVQGTGVFAGMISTVRPPTSITLIGMATTSLRPELLVRLQVPPEDRRAHRHAQLGVQVLLARELGEVREPLADQRHARLPAHQHQLVDVAGLAGPRAAARRRRRPRSARPAG